MMFRVNACSFTHLLFKELTSYLLSRLTHEEIAGANSYLAFLFGLKGKSSTLNLY